MTFRAIAITALLCSLGTGLYAQSGPTTGFSAPAPAAPAPAPEPEPTVSPTASVERTGAVPDTVTNQFNDWELRCVGETEECILFQVANNDLGRPAAEFTIIKLASGSNAVAGVTAVFPLGVILPEGVVFRVDNGRAQQFQYSFCVESGCVSRFGLNQGQIDSMKAGNNLTLTVAAINVQENPITLTISLAGFTAAYNALQ
ncbi:Invasion protein IalB, involved in pathogenesis [Monaibacterium marinum]|uniref:Invasion protein IalB, involved in pathogenesis n=1 Tax=Pontivivens marinum TaxID=1690039 RepID=A0A2C9CYM2_9RHOB|nr:invasion associated locus B family protein [Monaibacterium marinum]SOH95559.1 Invasion protein IalB, involved in pathogenesis [Monaibacterium marinum]